MEQAFFQFKNLDSSDSVETMKQIFDSGAYSQQGVFNKNFTQKFVSDLYYYLQNASNSGKTKFNALMVLKQIIVKNDLKIIGVLASSQQFLDFLQKIALNTDPKKSISEKGKNLFSEDRQGYGNKYITLIIDTIQYLAKKFPKNSKNEPTRFKRILLKLQSQNVNLPSQQTYYPSKKSGTSTTIKTDKNKAQPQRQQQIQRNARQEQGANEKKPSANFQALVRFVRYKIDEYIANLDEAEEVEQMQQIIIKTHQIFLGQLKKFDELGESIYQNNPNPTLLEEYLKVRGFLQEQTSTYNNFIRNNEFAPYYDTIKIKYQQIFPGGNTRLSKTPQQNTKGATPGNNREGGSKIQKKDTFGTNNRPDNSMTNNIKVTQSKTVVQKRGSYNNQRRYDSTDGQRQVAKQQRRMQRTQQRQRVGQDPAEAISGIFSKLQNRQKSPYRGFKQLRESLQKQTKDAHAHPIKSSNLGKVGASTLSKSNLGTSTIFNNVPNPSPPYKNYDGELITQSKQLQNILFDIKKQQSHRRFKVANFKNKSPLFENQSLQIGFKSQPIFQQFDGFNILLSMQLYFGNKSGRQIKDLQISFQADQNSLIYTNPRQISTYIEADAQLKHGLMIIPINVPYNFITMKVYYQCGTNTTRTTIAIPNSILQFSILVETPISEFRNYWENCTNILKTSQFKLSRHIPPNSIRKYMHNLSELTSYSEFSISGSTTDYEVCCLVDIHDDFEGALKINFRPDLNVVIQIGGIAPSEDGLKYLKFYLQTLQLILQDYN